MIDINLISEELCKKIRYEDDEHKYYRVSDNKLLAGVSSVSSLAKSGDSVDYLSQWKINEALEYLKSFIGGRKNIDSDILIDEFKNAKYAFKTKAKEASNIGTEIHEILERYIKSKINGSEWIFPKDKIISIFLNDFLKWEKENKVVWLASEILVGDADGLELAGRLDALACVNGKITIVDFKVANTITPSYFIQLAGYQICLSAMGLEVEDRLIIRLPKTIKRKSWNGYNSEMVNNKLEIIRPPTNIDHDIKTFKNLRCAYKWINQKTIKEYESKKI